MPSISLPPYEPIKNPLIPSARQALANLHTTHSLSRPKQHLKVAHDGIVELASFTNERLTDRTVQLQKKQARLRNIEAEQKGSPIKEAQAQTPSHNHRKHQNDNHEEESALAEEESNLQLMREQVDKLTMRMENAVRKGVDATAKVKAIETALVKAAGAATTASRQRQRNLGAPAAAADLSAGGEQEATAGEDEIEGPFTVFSSLLETEMDRYHGLSMRARYAQDNLYVGFRRLVHEAQHAGEDAPMLPNPSTWFHDTGSPAPGLTGALPAAGNRTNPGSSNRDGDEDEDDDIAIAGERISVKCPLTLRDFQTPLTSRKCPHSFEASAIRDMIAASHIRSGGSNRRGVRDGHNIVQCPVAGCEKMLTLADLKEDQYLQNKIKRIIRARAAAEEEANEDAESDLEDEEMHDAILGS